MHDSAGNMRSALRRFLVLVVPLFVLAASGCSFVASPVQKAADAPSPRVATTATTEQPARETAKPARKKSCRIKGNISTNTGERIYHVPGQQYYDQTVITASKGERWFCTEAEAKAAGWRKSKV